VKSTSYLNSAAFLLFSAKDAGSLSLSRNGTPDRYPYLLTKTPVFVLIDACDLTGGAHRIDCKYLTCWAEAGFKKRSFSSEKLERAYGSSKA
jgi:hypothetical protein